MSFATLAGVLWGLGITAATIGAGLRIRAGPSTWALLLASLLIVPWVPSPHAPIRSERTLYAGPDLLSDVPVHLAAVGDSARAMGLARVSRVRRIQGVTLLSENRRVQLRLPWLWAMVVAAVGLRGSGATRFRGRRTGSRGGAMRGFYGSPHSG